MRHLILTYLLLGIAVLLFGSCNRGITSGKTSEKDSIYSEERVLALSITQPAEAFTLINEAQDKKIFSPFIVHYLRAIVHFNGKGHNKTALLHARKAYADPMARNYPDELLQLLSLMATVCHANGDYAESVNHCAKGLEMAQHIGNKSEEANFHVTWGMNLLEMEQPDAAFGHIDLAINLLEEEARKDPCYSTYDNLCFAAGMKISMLIDCKRYAEAIAMHPFINSSLQKLQENADTPEESIHIRRCEMDAFYSLIAYTTGNRAEGDSLYHRVADNPFASTPEGQYLHAVCLLPAKRYDEALYYLHLQKRHLQETTDTMNWDYIDPTLRMEYEAYRGKGDWRSASRIQATMLALADSLRKRERKEDALELAEIYKTNEQAQEIERQAASIQKRNIYIGAFILILALAIIYIQHIRKINRIIQKKSDAMVKTIDELMEYKNELYLRQEENVCLHEEIEGLQQTDEAAETPPHASYHKLTERDRALFDRMSYLILSQRLYLRPDFGKQDLMKDVHVPSNKFAALFKTFAGCSFTQYIQTCRLDYAVRLMHEQPNWTLEAIAKEAQMSNGAFYSQFQRKYGMKPSDYREKRLTGLSK